MSDTAIEMHAAKTGAATVLTQREVRLPPPGPGELRVAIEAAGVAYADIVMRRGVYPEHRPPVTPGYDFVGRVEAIGPGVSDFHIGQRVAAVTVTGSYATRRNVPAAWVVPAPEGADATHLVAAVLNGQTAWQMLHRLGQCSDGDWVLVHGAAGGVGNILLDLARLAGLRAIGTASRGKHAAISAAGAVPVDYQAEDVAARARAISGDGVQAGFDHVGGRHFTKVTMASLRKTGVGVLYGGYNATRGGRINPLAIADLMMGARVAAMTLFGSSQTVAGYASPIWRDSRPALYRADLAGILALIGDGHFSPAVGEVFPLAQAAAAQQLLETRGTSGKIVLVPDGIS